MGEVVAFAKKIGGFVMGQIARKRMPRESLGDTVTRNARILLDEDWKMKKGEKNSKRQSVANIAYGRSGGSVATLQLMAERSKIPAWYIMLPLDKKLLKGNEMSFLVYTFLSVSEEGQRYILNAVEHAAKYMS